MRRSILRLLGLRIAAAATFIIGSAGLAMAHPNHAAPVVPPESGFHVLLEPSHAWLFVGGLCLACWMMMLVMPKLTACRAMLVPPKTHRLSRKW